MDCFCFLAAMTSGPLKAFMDSDFCGQLIVLVQIGMSVISWGVMVGKSLHLRDLRRRSARFVDDFVRQDDPLRLYLQDYTFTETPMEKVYLQTSARFANLVPKEQLLCLQQGVNTRISLNHARMELVETTCAHTTDEESVSLGHGMTMLAVVTSSAPLLGLFGTVWGVMLAFQAMASSGSANIAELAPGISSALLTTVVGLVVAIPSTIAYNFLQSGIDAYVVQLEGFGEELMGKLSLNYADGEGR